MRSTCAVEKCVPVISSALLCAMKASSTSAFGDRHVGAVLAQEDQRKRVLVLDAEHDRAGQARRVDADVADVAAFARDRLDQETPQPVVADARDQRGLEAQARAAERGVRRRAAQVLGEAGDILEAGADLLRVEIDRETAEADDVESPTGGERRGVSHRDCAARDAEKRTAIVAYPRRQFKFHGRVFSHIVCVCARGGEAKRKDPARVESCGAACRRIRLRTQREKRRSPCP